MNGKIFLAAIFILTISFASASGVCRNINQDGIVNQLDVEDLRNYAFNGYEIPAGTNADLNGDGFVDLQDVVLLIDCVYRGGDSGDSITSLNSEACNYDCITTDDLGDNLKETISDSGEKTLQSILDENNYSINVNDQTGIQVWKASQKAELEVTYLGGVSSYPHGFGYYKKGNLSGFVLLFQDIEYLKDGVPVAKPGDKFTISLDKGDEIGFAIDSRGFFNDSGIVATENNLNDPKIDQVLVFENGNEFVLGFEDTFRDFDFQDIIVSVKITNCEECTPKTCEEMDKVCGIWDDGCGNNLNCGPSTISCSIEYGTCTSPGEQVCDIYGNYGVCNAVDPRTSEVCDGLDNDCDGQIDEGLQCGGNITCSSNLNCGIDFDTSNFCSSNNVVKDHTSFTCHNPGTQDSYCSNSTSQILVQECSHMCMDGMCHEMNSTCGNGVVEGNETCDTGISNGIVCDNSNSDCTYCSSTCKTVQRLEKNHNNNHDNGFKIAEFMMSTCNPNWECTSWTECQGGIQTRTCVDTNHCGLVYNKPFEQTSCEGLKNLLIAKEKSSFPFWLLILLAIFVVLIIIALVNWR
jgi:hypothetical protein